MSAEELQALTNAIEGDRMVMVLALVLFVGVKVLETVVSMKKNGSTTGEKILTKLVADVGELRGQMQIVLGTLGEIRHHRDRVE